MALQMSAIQLQKWDIFGHQVIEAGYTQEQWLNDHALWYLTICDMSVDIDAEVARVESALAVDDDANLND